MHDSLRFFFRGQRIQILNHKSVSVYILENMDPQMIYQLLEATMHPDTQVRTNVEQQLKVVSPSLKRSILDDD